MAEIDYNVDGTYLTNVYTFMGWELITDKTSTQWQLIEQAGFNFDGEGFGKVGDRYVIACTDYYDNGGQFGTIGDYIDWTMPGGAVLHTIVGDTKSKGDPNWCPIGHRYPEEGSYTSVSVIEFCVDLYSSWYHLDGHANPGTPTCHPEWAGQLEGWVNVGSYFKDKNGVNVDGTTVGGAGSTGDGNTNVSRISYIEVAGGDNLLVHFPSGNPMLCYRCNTIWKPRASSNSGLANGADASNPYPTPITPTTTSDWTRAAEATEFLRSGSVSYSYNYGGGYASTGGEGWYNRGLDFYPTDGYCDCSQFICKLLYKYAPNTYQSWVDKGILWGTSAGDTRAIWNSILYDLAYLIYDSSVSDSYPELKAGDIMLVSTNWSGYYYPETGENAKRHVLIYMNDGYFWDMVTSPGPSCDNWGEQTPDYIYSVTGNVNNARMCVIRPIWKD